ncbi:hypothetical protein [Streptomyces katsurahamanus]|uniref:Uncharacterized protein n=1 Tax=Streptomyces katsurahamanus TaxID=2577098 RepID=A0ABW9NQA1_9ACTN|nr:hypothetical protein [Streptomyces katsurahamanus]MQS35480.1 hypothetical protein [Streptomyces katsurahamanus]
MPENSSRDLSPREEYEHTLDTVVTPLSEAYYSQLVQSVSSARGRAQAAQSTITLFAGGLMAALTITALADRPLPTQGLAIGAVALWLIAAVLYLRAVAAPIPDDEDSFVTTREELVRSVRNKVRQEAEEIDKRQRKANLVAAVAVALSLATFAVLIVTDPPPGTAPGSVVVESRFRSVLSTVCSAKTGATGSVRGSIVKGSLKTPFIEIKPARGVCTTDGATLQLPRGKVKAVRWSDG